MKTDSQIIDDLGGTGAVAEICHVTTGAVSQWRTDGIPKARRMYLKIINPDAFSVPQDDQIKNIPLHK